jgi:hypothetical protein
MMYSQMIGMSELKDLVMTMVMRDIAVMTKLRVLVVTSKVRIQNC